MKGNHALTGASESTNVAVLLLIRKSHQSFFRLTKSACVRLLITKTVEVYIGLTSESRTQSIVITIQQTIQNASEDGNVVIYFSLFGSYILAEAARDHIANIIK